MSVCGERPTTPGFFTSCVHDVGLCHCGKAVEETPVESPAIEGEAG